jgi:hypothetical protein
MVSSDVHGEHTPPPGDCTVYIVRRAQVPRFARRPPPLGTRVAFLPCRRITMRTSVALLTSVALALGGAAACADPRQPAQEIEKAEIAIDSADASGAPAEAPLEMKLAREKMEKAKSLLRDEEWDEAKRLAEQAQVDAQLAEAKAESETEREHAQELEKTIETLRNEAERGVEAQP